MLIKLKKANLKLKLKKCEFAKCKIKIFEYKIDAKDIRPDSGKVKIILKQLHLIIIIRIKAFLKVVRYFKKYIKDFEKIITSLY